jgi:enamine deaminase RidA (YjgF/YER057c/UK114 family)
VPDRQLISSGSPYESTFGFSRAVRVDDRVFVAGTAPIEPDGSTTPGGMAAQARRCLAIIEEALVEAGASLSDVVRTRIFVTDITLREEAATAHAEAFSDVRPAATIVQVSALVAPEMLVEIEAEAVIGSTQISGDE